MDKSRYSKLNSDPNEILTQKELDEGWHFCIDWDFLLIGPSMAEMECCTCDLTNILRVE